MLKYRYLSLSSAGNREQFERALFASELLFSSPLRFNDPFECRFSILADGSLSDWRTVFDRPEMRTIIGFPQAGTLSDYMISRMFEHVRSQEGPISDDLRRSILGDFTVCCFCSDNTNPLMWSHYASSHQGICLTFDLARDENYLIDTHEVTYQDEIPTISYFRSMTADAATKAFLTKASFWRYEAEWRTVRSGAPQGFRSFAPGMLTEVTLGAFTPESDRALLTRMCSLVPQPPVIRQASLTPGAYTVHVSG